MSEITTEQAAAALQILKDECGYAPSHYSGEFERTAVEGCSEYRFCGSLGFGGKFRNNGNNENVPYVDYYQENKTPERDAAVQRANERLRILFEKQ